MCWRLSCAGQRLPHRALVSPLGAAASAECTHKAQGKPVSGRELVPASRASRAGPASSFVSTATGAPWGRKQKAESKGLSGQALSDIWTLGVAMAVGPAG